MTDLYRPLDSERHEIRLLRVLPSVDSAVRLECQILYRFLDDVGEYEALSYVWGKPNLTEAIVLDDHELSITKNLHIALRFLRLETEARILWVDALCINQYDVAERSHQVTLMKDIYQRCKRDIAWLGPTENSIDNEEDHITTAFELSRTMHSKEMEAHFKQKSAPFRSPGDESPNYLDYDQYRAMGLAFTTRPLWQRIWVIQELAYAPEVTLTYGRHSLEWRILSELLGDRPYVDAFHGPLSHGDSTPILERMVGVVNIEDQRRIVRETEDRQTSTLLDVLARFKGLEATDPRDRIYGLLGLVTQKHPIRVDYCKSSQEVFGEVAEFIINSHKNLDIICQNPWQTDNPTADPSWAPDFDSRHYLKTNGRLVGLLFAQRAIFAAGRPQCEVPAVIEQDRLLRVKGAVLGKVGPILQPHYASADPSAGRRSYGAVLWDPREWMLLYFGTSLLEDSTTPYFNGEAPFRAYWRTLAMDCKAYPIKRLAQEDIVAEEEKWEQVARFDVAEDVPRDEGTTELNRRLGAAITHQMWVRNHGDWTFSVSENGLFTMLRDGARPGDVIAVLDGGKVPMVLREIDGRGPAGERKYTVINSVYVHGFMDGEAVSWMEQGKLEEQIFFLA